MELDLAHPEEITEEQVDFIESQANRLYDFALESRELLSKQAHTTIQWFFGIIVGGTGYIISWLHPQSSNVPLQWKIIFPLAIGVVIAAWQAFVLFRCTLLAGNVKPPGNEPKNLAIESQLSSPAHLMRLREATELQTPIEEAMARNKIVAAAVNKARWFVMFTPVGVALLLLALRFT